MRTSNPARGFKKKYQIVVVVAEYKSNTAEHK
jgi:hypothetical protein